MLAGLVKDVIDGIRDVSGLKPRLEGEASEGWLLLDYGDIILHMFSTEQREYYDLESLWSDSKVLIHLQ